MEKPFKGRVTRNAAVLFERGAAYDEIVSSIMTLHPDDWFSEGQAAVQKEQSQTRKSAELLLEKFVQAFEAASKAQLAYSELLRGGHSLEPDTYAFIVFKTWTLANILSEKVCLEFSDLKRLADSPFSLVLLRISRLKSQTEATIRATPRFASGSMSWPRIRREFWRMLLFFALKLICLIWRMMSTCGKPWSQWLTTLGMTTRNFAGFIRSIKLSPYYL